MSSQTNKPVCVIVGVGPGNGAAFARKFAQEGYQVALLARSVETIQPLAAALPDARAYGCDVTDATAIAATFAAIRSEMGAVETLVYNPGAGVWRSIEEITAEEFEHSWRVNAFGAFLVAKQVIPALKQAGSGNIVLIGATASRRGGAKTAAFAPAKAAQRSLAESMARHLWPAGIHVSLVMIDAVVDTPATRKMMPDKPDDFFAQPDEIADVVFGITQQKPSAWTFEMEVRPFGETW